MLKAIEGVYRAGKIELVEQPDFARDEVRVIVTFLEPDDSKHIDLRSRGIDATHAADLRARLATIAEDWDSPEMSIYDDYDSAKAAL